MAPKAGEFFTVGQLFNAFRKHAERHYRRADGSQTTEVLEYAALSKLVRSLFGATPAREFGPLSLKTVRQAMVDRGWCRSLINQWKYWQ